jgi:hypothetical protein
MPSFFLFVLDARGVVLSGLDIDFPDDAAAMARAQDLLSHPGCMEVEVWEGERRLVGRLSKPKTP